MPRFCFIDSSGIMKEDQIFGTGLLIVKNVGDMADKLNKNSQPAKELAKLSKDKKVEELVASGHSDEAIRLLRNSKRFEMKFDNVSSPKRVFYERMIDIFLSDKDNRFSAMVVNKQHPAFDTNGVEDAWETYTKYAASLVVQEMKNLPDEPFCIIVDEITRPRNKPLSLEDTLLSKIRNEVSKDESLDINRVFGALSIESHSNFPMQLCDLLIGAVMYDFKKKLGLVSQGMENKKDWLVEKLRSSYRVDHLAQDFTNDTFGHFHVFECGG